MDEPTKVTDKMRGGLAKAYAEQGFREYLDHTIKVANQNLIKVMDAGDLDRGKYFANRIATLKNLLEVARNHFQNVEKIRNVSNQIQDNEKGKDADEEIRESQV